MNQIRLEYIWVGGNKELRSKTKVVRTHKDILRLNDTEICNWDYDGSSTVQADSNNSEVIIKPVAVYKDPFRTQNDLLILCDTWLNNGEPHSTNTRYCAKKIFDKGLNKEPWFGMEQEFFIMTRDIKKPVGFPYNGYPNPQGQYYCSVGANNAFGREIAEEHLMACILAGIQISGINAEVAPGQWEFQIGPCVGISSGDHMIVARYLLMLIAEKHNIYVTFDPKPISGDWNGSGCHTNYSTKNMREGTATGKGIYYINEAVTRMAGKHREHMSVYGDGNRKRMTGEHETASYDVFTYGVGTRNTSIRIGNDVAKNAKGYFEDRRPSSNCNPYLVTSKIFETTVLDAM